MSAPARAGAPAPLTLEEIAAVLGVSKGAASRLRAGTYGHASALPERYRALERVVARVAGAVEAPGGPGAICRACPREDCSGCRIAELVGEAAPAAGGAGAAP